MKNTKNTAKIEFVKIFPFGVDAYRVWYKGHTDVPQNRDELFTMAEDHLSEWISEVNEQVHQHSVDISTTPLVYLIIDEEVYGKMATGLWVECNEWELPERWNVT